MFFISKKHSVLSLLVGLGVGVVATSTWGTQSTDPSLPQTVRPNTIFVIDSGSFDFPTGGFGASHTFRTNKQCPTGFNPYVALTASKVLVDQTSNSPHVGPHPIRGFGACVWGYDITPGPNYGVYFLTTRISAWQDWTRTVSYPVGRHITGRTSEGEEEIAVYRLGYPNAPSYTGIGGFYWELWCYPWGTVPPRNEGCAEDTNPYDVRS